MEYCKPTSDVLAKTMNVIQGSNTAAKGTLYIDGQLNPGGKGSQGFHNSVVAAYEADE